MDTLFHHELHFRVNRDRLDETTSVGLYGALGRLLFYKGRLSAAPRREMSAPYETALNDSNWTSSPQVKFYLDLFPERDALVLTASGKQSQIMTHGTEVLVLHM